MRRQNHSCDYCRKSKKACDGFAINRFRYLSPDSGAPSASPDSQARGNKLLSCSYCVRTKKQCSFNSNWGRAPSLPPLSVAESIVEQSDATKRLRPDEETNSKSTLDYDLELSLDDLSQAIRGHASVCSSYPDPSPSAFQSLGDTQASESAGHGADFGDAYLEQGSGSNLQNPGIGLDSWTDLIARVSPWDTMDMASLADHNQSTSQASQVDLLSCHWPAGDSSRLSAEPSLSGTDSGYLTNLGKRKDRRSSQADDERSLSVYSTDYMISTAANNHLIIGNLLGIYHDVLENNLACWLAEENCPYKMRQSGRLSSVTDHDSNPFLRPRSPQGGTGTREWGRDWSNRIYRRVTQLDRMAVRSKSIKLTRAQSHDASRALSLVIMAFATQWSQGRRQHHSQGAKAPTDDLGHEVETEFERNLQQSVWRQAKRALDDVAEVESFRVAYAEMVFGLMERPWDDEEETSDVTTGDFPDTQPDDMQSKVVDILAQDGPPVMLDRAARKMQVMKFRFEANETKQLGSDTSLPSWSKDLSDEDRETIGLLYWLAVMFDTVSAPMNERPVALPDEECEHDAAKDDHHRGDVGEQPKDSRSRLRWNVQLFTRGEHDFTTGSLYWPCPYDMATSAIARSAPIKILIFRHLSYLQNILRRKEFGQPIEDALWEATLVYRYWNTVYAPFYRNLVHHYETVPTRIRAWFVCIYIPWHLACLMLADTVEVVERSKFGLGEHSQTRVKADMVARIRKQSAFELSELARVTAPGDGTEQLPNYHHAVNEGPLLTEPWTVILVRAFAKSALFYLVTAREMEKGVGDAPSPQNQGLHEAKVRAGYCCNALSSLGKKSAMARQISRAFYKVLNSQ